MSLSICTMTGKTRYTLADARMALRRIKQDTFRKTRRGRVEQRAYVCDHCGDYHLTSQVYRSPGKGRTRS